MAVASCASNARDQPRRRKAVHTRVELDRKTTNAIAHISMYNKKLGYSSSPKRSMLHVFFIVLIYLATLLLPWSRLQQDYFVELVSSKIHITIAQDKPDVCGLVNDSSNIEWRTYTQAEQSDIERVASCLNRIGREDLSSLKKGEPTRKLHCPTEVTLESVRNTIKQYDTIWFGGDSIMEQQFFTLACMLDPSLPSLTDMSLFWHHSTNRSNHSRLELLYNFQNLAGFLITMNRIYIKVSFQRLFKGLVQTMQL
jgi:hypothetical protein